MTERRENWEAFTADDLMMDVKSIKKSFAEHLEYSQAVDEYRRRSPIWSVTTPSRTWTKKW